MTDESVRLLCHDIERADWIAIDTETSGLEPYAGDWITGISVCPVSSPLGVSQPLGGFYVPVGHKRGNAALRAVQALLRALGKSRAPHLFAHCTFDWAFLDQIEGWEPGHETLDIQVHRWLQDENAIKGLKPMGEMYLDEDAAAEQAYVKDCLKSPWENQTAAYKAVREAYPELTVPEARAMARRMRTSRGYGDLTIGEMGKYAARDSTLTLQLADYLGTLAARNEAPLKREMAVNRICYDMTKRGVSADRDALASTLDDYIDAEDAIVRDLSDEFADRLDPDEESDKPFNPNSGPQVAQLVYDILGMKCTSWTAKGQRSTAKNALEMMQGHPVVAQILEARHWSNAQGKIKAYLKYLDASHDGRIHGHYESWKTVTGRLSANHPNVTTIPRLDTAPEIREAFYHTPPGVERVGFDLVSAELWVMASITGDPLLTEILMEGRDLHTETAESIFGSSEGRWRTLAKNMNYGIPYGAGNDQMQMYAAKAGYAPEEAARMAKTMRLGHIRTFPRLHKVSKMLGKKGHELGKLPLAPPGRYRHFFSPGQLPVPRYTALNALVQGGVGEFMKDVMLAVYETEYRDQLILQVHDELVFDAEPGSGQEILKTLQSIADDVNPFKLRLVFDGKAWAKKEQS